MRKQNIECKGKCIWIPDFLERLFLIPDLTKDNAVIDADTEESCRHGKLLIQIFMIFVKR
jgi:hypothetical protein